MVGSGERRFLQPLPPSPQLDGLPGDALKHHAERNLRERGRHLHLR